MTQFEEASKQAMYDWIDAVERQLQIIREHVDPLPDTGDEEWTNQDWANVAHIAFSCGAIESSSSHMYQGIHEVLGAKLRQDAKRN